MMFLFLVVALPCVLASKTQFVVNNVKMAPTDVDVRLETQTPSKMTCSALCSSKDYVSFTFLLETNTCHCFSEVSVQVEQDVNGTSGIFFGKPRQTLADNVLPYSPDCLDLLNRGYTTDGVYVIQPPGGTVTETWCDMENGGWTLLLRRQDGSENFYREWTWYADGFGNRTGEYWLGLETLHLLTTIASSLWVHIESFGDVTPSTVDAFYDVFSVGDASTNYRLTVSSFTGNCGDSLMIHNGRMFTTIDRDNDGASINCAVNFNGGFWYNNCHQANPTGMYYPGAGSPSSQGLSWATCYGHGYSPRVYILKFKRNI